MTSEERAALIIRAIDSKQGRDIQLLGMEGLTLMTDYFVLCTGTSSTHIRTLADVVVEHMKKAGAGGIRLEGYEAAEWVLMDYGDVVVHIMSAETRTYYGLEELWRGARRVDLASVLAPA